MATVTETLLAADGTPRARDMVTVRLVTVGYDSDPRVTILQSVTVRTDADGVWSADLTPNDELAPANTYYLVERGTGTEAAFVVPAGSGPHVLQDLLIDPPADLDESALAVHLANALAHAASVVDGGSAASTFDGTTLDGGGA